ncbi:MAG: response regulator containing a CheY-like receiver domain and an DNA-binding domain [Segetibacter sp.]|nr:response regulator containing a CheY-like receiver domain and an DNA-binding domain [Segetibacter sp.]
MFDHVLENGKANDTLQEKIAALELVVDDLPVVIIVHNLETLGVEYMCKRGLSLLGLTLEELQNLGSEYHGKYFNPEDAEDYVPKIMSLLQQDNEVDTISFFQQVRPSESHDWKWYLSSSKVFVKDEGLKPSHIITVASPIDPEHHITSKVNRLLEEKNFLRKYNHIFASLTRREKEILKLMALGNNSKEIAGALHISEKTAKTHRRNIRAKLQAQSNYDITRFAQAFDLI